MCYTIIQQRDKYYFTLEINTYYMCMGGLYKHHHSGICPVEIIYHVLYACCYCLLLVSKMEYCKTNNLAIVANIRPVFVSTIYGALEDLIVLRSIHIGHTLL